MTSSDPESDVHKSYMLLALAAARRSPPRPTNYCVGACLVRIEEQDLSGSRLLESGYTLECAGNTHAEQSCFIKLARSHKCSEDELGGRLPAGTLALYTTIEPCNKRSVGNTPCVDRILALKREDGRQAISRVYVGISEPETFVGVNEGTRRLGDAGIAVVKVPGFKEEEILKVATAGHEKHDEGAK